MRATAVVLGLQVIALAVLAAEVQLARTRGHLPDEPLELDGRVGSGAGSPLRVVWLGDSTAAGVGASSSATALPTVVAAGLGRPVDLTVFAVSGASVHDVVVDQLPLLAALAESPDLIAISVGANDVTHVSGRPEFRRRYEAVLDLLPASSRIVLLGIPDMGSIPRLEQPLRAIAGVRGAMLDDVVRTLAAARGLGYVDIAAATGPSFRADPARFYAADDFHPSDDGYALWSAAILEVVGVPG